MPPNCVRRSRVPALISYCFFCSPLSPAALLLLPLLSFPAALLRLLLLLLLLLLFLLSQPRSLYLVVSRPPGETTCCRLSGKVRRALRQVCNVRQAAEGPGGKRWEGL